MEDRLIALIGEYNADKLVRLVELHQKLTNGEGQTEEEYEEEDEIRNELSSENILPLY